LAGRWCTMVLGMQTWESNTGSMRATQRFASLGKASVHVFRSVTRLTCKWGLNWLLQDTTSRLQLWCVNVGCIMWCSWHLLHIWCRQGPAYSIPNQLQDHNPMETLGKCFHYRCWKFTLGWGVDGALTNQALQGSHASALEWTQD
jgi:hypothetical protein